MGGRTGLPGHRRGPGALHQEEGQGDLSVQQRQVQLRAQGGHHPHGRRGGGGGYSYGQMSY